MYSSNYTIIIFIVTEINQITNIHDQIRLIYEFTSNIKQMNRFRYKRRIS